MRTCHHCGRFSAHAFCSKECEIRFSPTPVFGTGGPVEFRDNQIERKGPVTLMRVHGLQSHVDSTCPSVHVNAEERALAKRVDGWMRAVTYKPNIQICWAFRKNFGQVSLHLWLVNYTIDSQDQVKDTRINHGQQLDFRTLLRADRGWFNAWLFSVFERMEMHELGEFFQIDGAMLHDPHARDLAKPS